MSSEELAARLFEKSESAKNVDKTEEDIDLKKPPDDYLKSLQPLGMEDKEKVTDIRRPHVLIFSLYCKLLSYESPFTYPSLSFRSPSLPLPCTCLPPSLPLSLPVVYDTIWAKGQAVCTGFNY